MKRIKQKLNELITDIEKEIESRNQLYAKRAKSWSKDEKIKYLQTIDELGEMINELNDMAVELPEK